LGATVDDLAAMHHVFPTFAEGMKAAAEQALPQPVEMARSATEKVSSNAKSCRPEGLQDLTNAPCHTSTDSSRAKRRSVRCAAVTRAYPLLGPVPGTGTFRTRLRLNR